MKKNFQCDHEACIWGTKLKMRNYITGIKRPLGAELAVR